MKIREDRSYNTPLHTKDEVLGKHEELYDSRQQAPDHEVAPQTRTMSLSSFGAISDRQVLVAQGQHAFTSEGQPPAAMSLTQPVAFASTRATNTPTNWSATPLRTLQSFPAVISRPTLDAAPLDIPPHHLLRIAHAHACRAPSYNNLTEHRAAATSLAVCPDPSPSSVIVTAQISSGFQSCV